VTARHLFSNGPVPEIACQQMKEKEVTGEQAACFAQAGNRLIKSELWDFWAKEQGQMLFIDLPYAIWHMIRAGGQVDSDYETLNWRVLRTSLPGCETSEACMTIELIVFQRLSPNETRTVSDSKGQNRSIFLAISVAPISEKSEWWLTWNMVQARR
jgi:hypothetical protein